ncbi:hypothetical protein [Planctomyces sp. SH-PL62]|uniref:hypothetical protein n=1 Tax=Planctomyces sp. SH-PL62 TaxID=1636152 RepID=UPI00078C599F|nr:hypothetical protein [Planctomyces sp. SH-PL62]AMV40861.1 hypothetical protein VT85_25735 [Planctomyces sp. SH-PL62]
MSSVTRRGGIPGPENRTGLTRPSMTEAEFERRIAVPAAGNAPSASTSTAAEPGDSEATADQEPTGRAAPASSSSRSRASRAKPSKPKRVQRMFAIEEDVDKKLWLYAIHMGKDRSEVVNDLLRPLVASMVLYDSRDRRSGRSAEAAADRDLEGDAA